MCFQMQIYGVECTSLLYRYSCSDPNFVECIVKLRLFDITIRDYTTHIHCDAILFGSNTTIGSGVYKQLKLGQLSSTFRNDIPKVYIVMYRSNDKLGGGGAVHAYSHVFKDAIDVCVQFNNNRYYIEQYNVANIRKIPDDAMFYISIEPLVWYPQLTPIVTKKPVQTTNRTIKSSFAITLTPAVVVGGGCVGIGKRKRGRPKGSKNKPKVK